MKVLMLHNFYQQPGGEDRSFASEAAVLEEHGVEVLRHTVHNDAIEGMGRLPLAARTLWSSESARDVRRLIRAHRPQVAHFQNIFPLLSPAAYWAAKSEGVAVVQSVRNYRLLCVNSLFLRQGQPCERCLGRAVAWPGIAHACYRDSRAASAGVAAMAAVHRGLGTWRRKVDVYVAMTEFARRKLIQGGLPAEKIVVKPNFVHPDPGSGEGGGGYALFVGRLSPEKGLDTALAAWRQGVGDLRLVVVGDGPLRAEAEAEAARHSGIEVLGRREPDEVLELMRKAEMVVVPSRAYETFGRVVVEAFACGTPVVVSSHGAVAELVEDGVTGRCFRPGDAEDLASKVKELMAGDRAALRHAARRQHERCYTVERNYEMLADIYRRAREGS